LFASSDLGWDGYGHIVMLTIHKTVVLLINLILVADSAQRFGSHVAWDFNGCSFCNALIMNYWR